MLWASFYWFINGISTSEEEARNTARRAYQNNPLLTSYEIGQAKSDTGQCLVYK